MREFKTNQDLYAFTEELIALSIRNGDESAAQLLHDALRCHFTASEIFGEIRIALKNIQTDQNYLQPYRNDIKKAIHFINMAFRTWV
jgi:hypothetical protein